MDKTYHYSRSNYIIAGILLFLAVIVGAGSMTAENWLPGLFFAAIPGVMGLLFINQAALTWQVDEDQIVWRRLLRGETCIRWADLQRIHFKADKIVNATARLEGLDDTHIDLFANLPRVAEIVLFMRTKRPDLWKDEV